MTDAQDTVWQPIETAPTDDDARVLLWSAEWGDDVVIGERRVFSDGSGWFCSEDEGPLCWGYCEPTHWMPLPPPPSTGEALA